MSIEITNLSDKNFGTLSQIIQRQFQDHIIDHFGMDKDKIHATMTISQEKNKNDVILHFHYKKKHAHLHAKDENVLKSTNHVIKELEREIKKEKQKTRRLHRNNRKELEIALMES